eukprot:TRINITY_DN4202_c0_g1_i3.p2 TRINITY_DN4202_c0_g1~~TRINITY_DN4202_c0_g1_i3.p2  ORF type:complete len:112 (+),score=18.31 TRINITY_DN4202_c0_g1_i3:318-653(+)
MSAYRNTPVVTVKTEKNVRKPGDWECPSCNNVNFSWRSTCHRVDCTTQKPETGDEFTRLVEKIKMYQRQSVETKEAWGNYCNAHGDSIRDPSKHTIDFLRTAAEHLIPQES